MFTKNIRILSITMSAMLFVLCIYCSEYVGQADLLEHIIIQHYIKGDERRNPVNNTHFHFYNYRMAFDRYMMHFETWLNKNATFVFNKCKQIKKTAEKLMEHSNNE